MHRATTHRLAANSAKKSNSAMLTAHFDTWTELLARPKNSLNFQSGQRMDRLADIESVDSEPISSRAGHLLLGAGKAMNRAMVAYLDNRTWGPTDRPGERITVCQLKGEIEVVSVQNSRRHWRETHTALTLALIHRDQPQVAAEWRTRGRDLASTAGTIMGMEPGDLHSTHRVHSSPAGASFDVVRFSPNVVARAASELGVRGAFHLKFPAVDDGEAYAGLERLVCAVAAGDDELAIDCAVAHALTTVITRCGEAPALTGVTLDPIRDGRLRRVKKFLGQNLCERPTLTQLEEVAGLSQYRLCTLFKQAYGVTIGQYWNALRLAEAVRLLQLGKPIKLIVAELGYGDEPYLSRVFKQHYGLAPGAWLTLYRANDWSRTRPSDRPPSGS